MEIFKNNNKFSIDLEKTKEYYKKHSLCDCGNCRNFYAQIGKELPQLKSFLLDFGVDIARPDELGSVENGKTIDYVFASYTVCGSVLECPQKEIALQDGKYSLKIIMDDKYIPNEQDTNNYFIIGVYGITLNYVLEEP